MMGDVAMVPDGLRLTMDPDPPADFQRDMGKLIEAFMVQTVPGKSTRFAFMLHDAEGALVGGLSGTTYWDWLFVAALWVHGSQRRKGAGTALLAAAESHAAGLGCHSVWLDTFQASGFYEKLGYAVFGALEDYPSGQTRSFLRKRIASLTSGAGNGVPQLAD